MFKCRDFVIVGVSGNARFTLGVSDCLLEFVIRLWLYDSRCMHQRQEFISSFVLFHGFEFLTMRTIIIIEPKEIIQKHALTMNTLETTRNKEIQSYLGTLKIRGASCCFSNVLELLTMNTTVKDKKTRHLRLFRAGPGKLVP